MVFPFAGGIVLATDSRSTTKGASGKIDKITDDSVKLLPVRGDMGVLTHGIRHIGTSGTSMLSEAFPLRDETGMNTVIGQATEIFLQADREWGAVHPDYKRSQGDVGFLVAGYDTTTCKNRIFGFSSPGYLPCEINHPYAIEGKWTVAHRLAQRLFKYDLSADAICAVALFLLRATAEGDPSVGGDAQLAIISPEEGYMSVGKKRRNIIAHHSEKLFRRYKGVLPN